MTDHNSQFMAILTAVGEAKQANANALGIPWLITHMGVGDANGTDPTPERGQTSLINERRRASLNELKIDPDNEAIIVAEQVIPENVGGWWIREIGLYDEAGDLVAVANCPPTFKPELSQGSGRTQLVRLHLLVSSTQNIVLKVDPSVVLATRAYVDSLTVRASQEDAELGEDNGKIATMLRVFQAMRSGAANATELIRGTLRLATAEQAQELTAGDVAITPETLGAALNASGVWVTRAIGEEIWLDDSNPFVEIPPTDSSLFRYIKLSAGENGSGGYNEGILINETVSGSAPLIEATAEINLPDSPFHGQTVRLLNTERRMFRAGEAAAVQDDALQNISGDIYLRQVDFSGGAESLFTYAGGAFTSRIRQTNASRIAPATGQVSGATGDVLFDASNVARTSFETRPRNIGRTVYMRIL